MQISYDYRVNTKKHSVCVNIRVYVVEPNKPSVRNDGKMENQIQFNDDCLMKAVRQANGKNLLFSTCLNPVDFYEKVTIPKEITSTFLIAMTCSDEEITKR